MKIGNERVSESALVSCYQLRGVTKTYGQRQVLALDALDVRRGEVLAVVGPSGAGKSTLLRLLNFLEPPTAGAIRFLGTEFSSQESMPLWLRRQVTTVFQRPLLLNRTVYANVAYGLRLRGRRNDRRHIEGVLRQVGLDMMARQPARTLSGGEAQRVALARAIVLEPEVLLLDEPTANLDPFNVALIEAIIQEFNHRRGGTVLMVTHNIFQAQRLAHRIALLLEGRLVEVADTQAFFQRPQDPRTAAFVRGEMIY